MDAGQESTSLVNLVEVGRRFQRSVNLDRDTGSPDALNGYVVTPAVRRALSQITDGLGDAAGDRAWSLVGPYGSGKSAFAVFLADLFSPSGSAGATAARRLLNGSGGIDLPHQPLYPAVLTAERAPLDTLLLKSLGSTLEAIWTTRPGAKPRVLKTIQRYLNGSAPALSRCATSDVVGCFEEAVQTISAKTGAGLLLVVDEAGKALEYAAQQPTRGDVYLLQALAEAAARSNGVPFVILTVLHQSFDQYAHQLGTSDRNEWAKVQGRFGELAFREGGDQIIRLTAAAIRRSGEPRTDAEWMRLVSATAGWISAATGWDESQLARHLDACWPLHPVTTALLGPLFRGGLAQNERSLFAFLSAGEPRSFRDFLRTKSLNHLYTVDLLHDYATGMLGNRVLGRDGRRWAEIETALKRLSPQSDAVDEQVLKTVGLLGMFGEQVGLRASAEIVGACIGGGGAAADSLARLKQESALVFRQFRDAFQIWEGSDLDLDDLVSRAARHLPSDFSAAQLLEREASRTPLVARRHLFETGTLRFFDVRFVDACRLMAGDRTNLSGEADGIVILTLPRTEREADDLRSQQGIAGLAIELLGAGKPVVLVVPDSTVRLMQLARELAASQIVRTSTPELQSDPAARSELNSRLEELERQAAAEVARAFDPRRSDWFTSGQRLNVASWRDASSGLSDLCDLHYPDAPAIRNELLNRRALSTSAARARRNLIEAMILRGDAAQLGFEGNPPEVSMYRSLLEAQGLHRRRHGMWGFGAPKGPLQPVWKAIGSWLEETEAGRRPLDELYDRLRRAPFGIKDGPLPVVVVAALLAHEDQVALYERGSYVPALTPVHAERLLRSPELFEARRCRIDSGRQRILDNLARTLLSLSLSLSQRNAPRTKRVALLDLVRALARFVAGLPPYARRTQRLNAPTRAVREAILRAREPARLVFADLPAACGCPDASSTAGAAERYAGALHAALAELHGASRALLGRARSALTRHLHLPETTVDLTVELRRRAGEIRELAVDPVLRRFVLRASDETLDADEHLTSLLAQLADKPPAEWTDRDEELAEVRLAQVGRHFRDAEALLAGTDPSADSLPLVRLAVTRRGAVPRERVLPLRRADRTRLEAARDRVLAAATSDVTTGTRRDEALAALALAAERLLTDDDPPRKEFPQPVGGPGDRGRGGRE